MKNLNTENIIKDYATFAEPAIRNRFIKHKDVLKLIKQLPADFKVTTAGYSVEQRVLNLIEWGNGPVKVFLWSQMHGDEATGTMALSDLVSYLQQDENTELVNQVKSVCTLYILPLVNPDGAERFTRRNAQQIDINRDFLKTVSPEAKILKELQAAIRPDFGFNLHDQLTLWSVNGSKKPATLSFLAPAFDEQLSNSPNRERAMRVIADMFTAVTPFLPGHIGLFDDEHEPRAFGDNFQLRGTSTILIEAGGLVNDDEKQEIRKYYFLAILAALHSISTKTYQQQQLANYFDIAKNNKQIFHILIHQIRLNGIEVSIGINYEEKPMAKAGATFKNYTIQDIGDMDNLSAYHIYQGADLQVNGEVLLYENADFQLLSKGEIILSFKNGILESKL
ncbi:hypothetical protein HDC92_001028 [Pedobacter sp. AK017]|uniref:M14 family zinc carboxypeptidase n=1 Tax=Pedobacter sp. AK017 TaxID=2723073 RepID=UPI001620BB2F|nr:M14 family zinc carboxypeptidase [Pedobacter sp. AK017]MBB5437356.1 hypothetical protein [Pedobacter sp. AK017]